MGPTSLSFILSVQHSVKWGQRGVATGAVIFLRTIGGAMGVGLLGAALGWELAHRLAAAGATGINITAALRPETHQFLSAGQLAIVQANLGHALRDVYIQMAALGDRFDALRLLAARQARDARLGRRIGPRGGGRRGVRRGGFGDVMARSGRNIC